MLQKYVLQSLLVLRSGRYIKHCCWKLARNEPQVCIFRCFDRKLLGDRLCQLFLKLSFFQDGRALKSIRIANVHPQNNRHISGNAFHQAVQALLAVSKYIANVMLNLMPQHACNLPGLIKAVNRQKDAQGTLFRIVDIMSRIHWTQCMGIPFQRRKENWHKSARPGRNVFFFR